VKTTSALALAVTALAMVVVGWGLEWVVVSRGFAAVIPPATWSAALAIIGLALVGLAWPIRKRVRSAKRGPAPDPFYATRVVVLAQASSRAGAGLAGAAAGILIFVLGRPVVASSSVGLTVWAVAGAIVLVAGALVAERWCTLPPEDSTRRAAGAAEGEPV